VGRWPALRTKPVPNLKSALKLWAQASATANVFAVVLGVALFLVAEGHAWATQSYHPREALFEGLGLIFLFSPALVIPVQVIIAPVITTCFRVGYAGWAIAVLCGACAGSGAFFILEDFAWTSDVLRWGGFLGACFGALFWVSVVIYASLDFERTDP
jgi:hypothetical protein